MLGMAELSEVKLRILNSNNVRINSVGKATGLAKPDVQYFDPHNRKCLNSTANF